LEIKNKAGRERGKGNPNKKEGKSAEGKNAVISQKRKEDIAALDF